MQSFIGASIIPISTLFVIDFVVAPLSWLSGLRKKKRSS